MPAIAPLLSPPEPPELLGEDAAAAGAVAGSCALPRPTAFQGQSTVVMSRSVRALDSLAAVTEQLPPSQNRSRHRSLRRGTTTAEVWCQGASGLDGWQAGQAWGHKGGTPGPWWHRRRGPLAAAHYKSIHVQGALMSLTSPG